MRRSLPRRLDALPTLVSLVREFLASEGLADVDPFAVDLVLEELFTNLVRHGHSGSDTIEVELEREDARLRLLLRDRDSERFDPTQAPEVDVTFKLAILMIASVPLVVNPAPLGEVIVVFPANV